MPTIKPLLLALLMCCCLLARAQEDDKLTYDLNYGKTPASKGGGTFVSNDLKLLFPIKAGKSTFTIGPDFGIVNISHTGSLLDSASLKTIGLSFGYRTRVSEKTMFMISAEPLIASDFQEISGEDIRFKSDALFLIPTSKKFAIGFGLGYQYQFSGSQLLPIVTMVWHVSDNITLGGPLPLIPRIDFKLSDKWTLGAGLKVDYSSYRLSSALYQSRYVQYRNTNIGINTKYKADKHWEIGGFLGVGSRSLQIYNKDQTVPLRIYGWNIGGGSYTPYFTQKYSGPAFNLNLAYKL